MNNQMFLNEIHEYIDVLYKKFEKYQSDVLDTLDEFDRICINNKLTYYVGFGSLLGLYRDGNLLPWDYDIDVLVPITEKDRLIEVLKKDLNDKYYFYCPEVDSKCRHYCMRITKKGFDSSAVHMDVFFYIGAPDDIKSRERFRKRIKKANLMRKIKLVDINMESMGVNVFKYAGYLNRIRCIWKPLVLLDIQVKRMCEKYPLSKAKYVTTMQAAADTYTIDVLGEPTRITVNGKQYNAPTDIISFLNQTYKNYKDYPQIESRFDEFYKSIKRLEYFECNQKMKDKMDYQINTY